MLLQIYEILGSQNTVTEKKSFPEAESNMWCQPDSFY